MNLYKDGSKGNTAFLSKKYPSLVRFKIRDNASVGDNL